VFGTSRNRIMPRRSTSAGVPVNVALRFAQRQHCTYDEQVTRSPLWLENRAKHIAHGSRMSSNGLHSMFCETCPYDN